VWNYDCTQPRRLRRQRPACGSIFVVKGFAFEPV